MYKRQIALDLSPNEFEIAKSELENYTRKTITTLISRVGLFLNVDEKHWIVVSTEKFGFELPEGYK